MFRAVRTVRNVRNSPLKAPLSVQQFCMLRTSSVVLADDKKRNAKKVNDLLKSFNNPDKSLSEPTKVDMLELLRATNFVVSPDPSLPAHLNFNDLPKTFHDLRVTEPVAKENSVAREAHFVVLGNGSPGGTKSLLLYTPRQYYVFNCSEGTNCILGSSEDLALKWTQQVLFTSKSWSNFGGVCGLFLTINTSRGGRSCTIHGPKDTFDLFEINRQFIQLNSFVVENKTDLDPPHSLDGVTVNHVTLKSNGHPIYPEKPKYSEWTPTTSVTQMSTGLRLEGGVGVFVKPRPLNFEQPMDTTVTAYVVKLEGVPPMICYDKIHRLGVRPKEMAKLKEGQDVTLENGTVVKTEDVLDDGMKSSSFVVIEILNETYFDALLNEEKLQCTHESLKDIQGVFHFTPSEIAETATYKQWINSFPSHVRHIMLNDGNSNGYWRPDMAKFFSKLHMINPKVFPFLPVNDLGFIPIDTESQWSSFSRLNVRPELSEELPPPQQVDAEELLEELEPGKHEIQKLQNLTREHPEETSRNNPAAYPFVTFLGTGSGMGHKYRNGTGILVETEKDKYFLLDCAEGTVLQLHRLFGRDKTQEILRNLKAVFISHLHADHHLGLVNVILSRNEAFAAVGKDVEMMYLLGPKRINNHLLNYHQLFEPILTHLRSIRNEHLLPVYPKSGKGRTKTMQVFPHVFNEFTEYIGIKSIKTAFAVHCTSAFSVSFVCRQNNFKIVFSGDTRPNNDLIRLGASEQQTDLLIHEATVEHFMQKSALHKRHSTFTEAVQDGSLMKAKFTLLTHFSARYPKIPPLNEFSHLNNVGVAWDFMTVNRLTLKYAPMMFPAVRKVFADVLQDLSDNREMKIRTYSGGVFKEEQA